jgi:hypothetical protein
MQLDEGQQLTPERNARAARTSAARAALAERQGSTSSDRTARRAAGRPRRGRPALRPRARLSQTSTRVVAPPSIGRVGTTDYRNLGPVPIHDHMGANEAKARNASRRGEIEITDAAISGLSRLLSAVRGRIETHASGDGGLICEDRTFRARPTIWRVSPDGAVLADTPYDFRLRAFIPAGLPPGFRAP